MYMNNSLLQGTFCLTFHRLISSAPLSCEIFCCLMHHTETWGVPSSPTQAWGVCVCGGVIMNQLSHMRILHSCAVSADMDIQYWVHIHWVTPCSHAKLTRAIHSWGTHAHRWNVTCWLNTGWDAHHSASSKEWSCMTCTFTEACSLTFSLLMNESQPTSQRWPYASEWNQKSRHRVQITEFIFCSSRSKSFHFTPICLLRGERWNAGTWRQPGHVSLHHLMFNSQNVLTDEVTYSVGLDPDGNGSCCLNYLLN